MGKFTGNVVIVVGDHDVDAIKRSLEWMYELTFDTVQTVTLARPYRGEIRTEGNTLLHIATEVTLKEDLYSLEYIDSTLKLDALEMTTEALKRANLILVLLRRDDGNVSYFPYASALYFEEEDYY
jgi:hypothetical protein